MLSILFLYLIPGIALVWVSAEKLEKYSVLVSKSFGLSPFFIGSTVIAFGTSAPEMLTTLFAAVENKGGMIIGNVVGSNVTNIALVFGLTLLVLTLRNINFRSNVSNLNLLLLLISTIVVWAILSYRPFYFVSSIILFTLLISTILSWYKSNEEFESEDSIENDNWAIFKLVLSIISLIFAAWLITEGALQILSNFGVGELFIGFTILAIGTSLPEIAASIALALKGRYEAVAGALIGSNIFNGLFVLAIPGLLSREELMMNTWVYDKWIHLLVLLLFISLIFITYLKITKNKVLSRSANISLCVLFFSTYLYSLMLVFE